MGMGWEWIVEERSRTRAYVGTVAHKVGMEGMEVR